MTSIPTQLRVKRIFSATEKRIFLFEKIYNRICFSHFCWRRIRGKCINEIVLTIFSIFFIFVLGSLTAHKKKKVPLTLTRGEMNNRTKRQSFFEGSWLSRSKEITSLTFFEVEKFFRKTFLIKTFQLEKIWKFNTTFYNFDIFFSLEIILVQLFFFNLKSQWIFFENL